MCHLYYCILSFSLFPLAEYMKELEAKYGGSRAAWFLLVFFVMIALLFAMGGMALIANVVGFLYPAFASFKV